MVRQGRENRTEAAVSAFALRRDKLDCMRREVGEIERVAIWTAHLKRCAYCGEPIKYSDLEIDHILPASLAKSPDRLRGIVSKLALPPDFSIGALRNLLPAHGICNSKKRDRVFNEANVRYFLEIADQKLRRIEDLIPKLELEASRDRLLALVRSALQSGNADLSDILETASKTDKFPLNVTVDFESGSWDVLADPERINGLFDEPVHLHVEGAGGGLPYTDGKGSEMSVSTCREYKEAIAAGYYPRDNTTLKLSFALATTSAILEAAWRAKLAPISYIRSPRMGLANLEMLPAILAPTWRNDGSEIVLQSDGATIQELVEAGVISVEIQSDAAISVECEDHGVILSELMRADLDGDGVEEILIKVHSYIKFATHRSLWIGLLCRKDAVSPFECQLWDSETVMAQRRHHIARAVR